MSSDRKKAEETAINAGKAMVRLIDFSVATLTELAKSVCGLTGLRGARTNPVRYSMQDAYVVHRHTTGQGEGDVRVERYLYSPFITPHQLVSRAGGGRFVPFLAVSLVSSEGHPPVVIYGLLRDLEGRERNEEAFLEHYMLWLNEGLNEIKKNAIKENHHYRIAKELRARADSVRLTATVLFGEIPLFEITEDNLSEHAESIGQWMLAMLSPDEESE